MTHFTTENLPETVTFYSPHLQIKWCEAVLSNQGKLLFLKVWKIQKHIH